MPDLTSISVKEAKMILNKLGIKYEMHSTGYVQSQSIEAGSKVDDNMTVVLN